MLTLTSFRSCSSAIRSRTGATAWHGPHHSAQKSTSTLPSDSRTSCSKVDVVAVVAIRSFRELHALTTSQTGLFFPGSYNRKHVHTAPGQAGSQRARARDARALGAGGNVRAIAQAQPRQPEVVVRRRACDREQEARRPYRVGTDAEGRLPALQGPARLRPALPERLRLPGPLDRGRRRAGARPELEAGHRGVRAGAVRGEVPRRRRLLLGGADARLEAPRP